MFIYFMEFTHDSNNYVKVGITSNAQSRGGYLRGRFLNTYNIHTRVKFAKAENAKDIEHLVLGLFGINREAGLFKLVTTEVLNVQLSDILDKLASLGVTLVLEELAQTKTILEPTDTSTHMQQAVAEPCIIAGLSVLDDLTVLVSDTEAPVAINMSNLSESCRFYGWSRPQAHRVLTGQGSNTRGYFVPANPPKLELSETYSEGWAELPTKMIKVILHKTGEIFYTCIRASIMRYLGTSNQLTGVTIRDCEFPILKMSTKFGVQLYYRIST